MSIHGDTQDVVERGQAVCHKYEDLFLGQPYIRAIGIVPIKDENGEWTEKTGFVIRVTEKMGQNTLPPGAGYRTVWMACPCRL